MYVLIYLPIFNSIFNKSNLRMSIGYLEPLVYSYFLQIAYWGAQQLQLKSPKACASFSRDYEELFEMRCATLADCRPADLESQHASSSYPKSFLKSAQPPLCITCLQEFPRFRSKQT